MKRLQTIFAVLVVVLALANAKQTNNKQAVIQMELAPHQKIDLTAVEMRSKYCYGDVDYDLPPECQTFDADCGFCYTQDFIYECLYNCGNGDCAGSSDVCPAGFLSYCTSSFIVCSQCYQRYELCSCPSGMTMNIFANQSRTCSLVPCPVGQFRVDPNCSICQDCDEGCGICENTGDNCYTCEAPYCWVEGNKCVDPNTATCPPGLFKLMTDTCFECNPTCPLGMYPNSDTGRCEYCADGCSECTSYDFCIICEPFSWNGYCMYNNQCVQTCPDSLLMLPNDPNDPNQCFQCVNCNGCPGVSWCDYNNLICSTDCVYPGFIFQSDCITTCPAGTFQTPVPLTSDPVQYTCVTCDSCPSNTVCNSDTNQCQECNPPNVINDGFCLPSCPSGSYSRPDYVNNNILICVVCEQCPFGTFCDADTNQCNTCSDTCQQCIDSSTTCMPPCASGKKWYQFQCIDDCPSDTYLYSNNDFNNIGCVLGQDCYCGNCPSFCSSCIGGGINDCTGCYAPYKLTTSGTCVETCPEGSYDQDGFCQCCNKLCTSCFGASSTECGSCVEGSLLDGTTCMESWDVQAYYNNQLGA